MVQSEDFKIELVYADTKMPFKEHTKDGKIFVEVEPDVEYFISIQQNGASRGGATVSTLSVDGTDLGYRRLSSRCANEPTYEGVFSRENGFTTIKALKFTKPLISQDGTNVTRGLLMGKVEIMMYEGTLLGYKGHQKDVNSKFTAAAVDINQSGLAKKKSLRSGEGEIKLTTNTSGQQEPDYKLGSHFDTVTLNYCTALGLIEVGILKKPDAWTHHRMKRPANPDQGEPRVRPKHIHDPGAASEKKVELFDLFEAGAADSDDEN
jgi:hypothetical protein